MEIAKKQKHIFNLEVRTHARNTILPRNEDIPLFTCFVGFYVHDFQCAADGVTEKKSLLAKRTQEQLQEIWRRKQNLSLNLKRALPASPSERPSSGDKTASSSDLKSFQDASNRKLEIASVLSLLPQSVPSSIDTVETFHTAAADSPDPPITAFVDADTTNDFAKNDFEDSQNSTIQQESSDQGDITHDCRRSPEAEIHDDEASPFAAETMDDEEEKSSVAPVLPENMLQDSLESPIQHNPAMKRLNQRIARQRMMLMRCLGANTPSKEDLNRQIMILQDLQRQQIELEVSLLEDERKCHRQSPLRCSDEDGLVIANEGTEDYVQNEPNAYCSVEPTNNSSAILLTVATTRSQLFRNNRPNTNDQETSSETTVPRRSSSRGYSTVYLTVNKMHSFFSYRCYSCS